MGTLAVHWGWLDTVPGFPDRLRENPPRQGFFEHPEYLAVRVHLPAPWQDILDIAVPSPSHIPLACRAHQSECGRTPPTRGRPHREDPRP